MNRLKLFDMEPWQEDLLPRVLPVDWQQVASAPVTYENGDGVRVLISARVERDQKRWLHVSLSRRNRLPTWADLRIVKKVFVGRDRLAVQVFPRDADYVNIHPYVLHLWSCLDGDPVPDFRHEGQI